MLQSYVTVATDDITCIGCLVLCNSLKQTGTEQLISVLIYPNVSHHLRNVLLKSFDYVFYTKELSISSMKTDNSNYHQEYEKLKCWLLIQFTKCVFLESDVLVVENIDELFERSEFSAVADPKWPDYFDSGVFVFKPSLQTYQSLIDFSLTNEIQKSTIQCLLNWFFNNWGIINIEHKIPFIYNCQLNSTFYTHTNALVYFGRSIKAARLGHPTSQMMQPLMSENSNYDNWNRLWLQWWKIFNEMVKPVLNANKTPNFNRTNWEYKSTGNNESNFEKNLETEILSIVANDNLSNNECKQNQTVIPFMSNIENPAFEHQTKECCLDSSIDSSEDNQHQSNDDTNEEVLINVITCPDQQHNKSGIIPSTSIHSLEYVVEPTQFIEKEFENKDEVENNHRQQWERGEIDYMGKDSFQNILSKLNAKLTYQNDIASLVTEEE